MKCTHCHEKEANTHIKRTINGVTQEMYLCEDCAKELGVMDEFAFEPLSMDNFFGSFGTQFAYGNRQMLKLRNIIHRHYQFGQSRLRRLLYKV